MANEIIKPDVLGPGTEIGRPGRYQRVQNLGRRLLEDWWKGKKPTTQRAYKRDLEELMRFLQEAGERVESLDDVVRFLLQDPMTTTEAMLDYVDHLKGLKRSSATISRYVHAVKSVLHCARRMHVIDWRLDIPIPTVRTYTNTLGPPTSAVTKIVKYYESSLKKNLYNGKFLRDRAIVLMLITGGFRRFEVTGLDTEHVNFTKNVVMILGKGRHERVPFDLPEKTMRAIRDWMKFRNNVMKLPPGPLFVSLSNISKDCTRLEGQHVWLLVKDLEKKLEIDVPLRPHGFRHFAITQVATTQGLTVANRFARQDDPKVTLKYIDNSQQMAKQGTDFMDSLVSKLKKGEDESK